MCYVDSPRAARLALMGALLAAGLAISSVPAVAAPDRIVTVGTGCQFGNLQDAYDAIASPDILEAEIRVLSQPESNARLVIDDLALRPKGFVVRVIGGFFTCNAAASTGRTTLIGNNTNPLVEVSAGRNRTLSDNPVLDRTVILENLDFTRNDLSIQADHRGAGLHVTAGRVEVRNSNFSTLEARDQGGAIYQAVDFGWVPSLHLDDVSFARTVVTSVEPGTLAEGGAIYCRGEAFGTAPSITGREVTGVLTSATKTINDGEARGGFAHLELCDAELSFGRSFAGFGLASAFVLSQGRTSMGGGFSVVDGTLRIRGTLSAEAIQAISLGSFGEGGLFHLTRSELEVDRLEVSRVAGGLRGGVLTAEQSSDARIGCTEDDECPLGGQTSFIDQASAQFGAAFASANGSVVRVANVVIRRPLGHVNAPVAHLNSGTLVLAGSTVRDAVAGGDAATSRFAFQLEGAQGSELVLQNLTMDGNPSLSHIIGSAVTSLSSHDLTINSSVFGDPSVAILRATGVVIDTDGCVASKSDTGLPANSTSWRLVNPALQLFDANALYEMRSTDGPALRNCVPFSDSVHRPPFDLDGDRTIDPDEGQVDMGADRFVERRRFCASPKQLLDDPSEEVTISVADDAVVGDLRFFIDSSEGSASYRMTLRHGSKEVVLGEAVQLRPSDGPSRLAFDDEPGLLPEPIDAFAVRPDEALRRFDGQSRSGNWTLRAERVGESSPARLERWCLEVAEESQASAILFSDDFESGDLSAWSG